MIFRAGLLTFTVLLLFAGLHSVILRPETESAGQRPQSTPTPQQVDENDVIRVETTLVTVPVSVVDQKNRYVADLRQNQFRVYENGVEQQIAYFYPTDKPFMVGLLLDISDSTQPQLKLIEEAAIAFIDELRQVDQVFLVVFDSRIRLLAQPQLSREKMREGIRALQSGHGTSLYAVVAETIKEFPTSIPGRKAIVLLTDGIDTTSPEAMATFKSSVKRAEESDVVIYPVQVNPASELDPSNPASQLKSQFPEGKRSQPAVDASYARANNYLRQLAAKTGGEFYAATDLEKLSETFARVADYLRRQYSLSYYPKAKPQAGETREIKVVVSQPHVSVRARATYLCCRELSAPKP